MKNITSSILLFLIGFLGLVKDVKAQSDAILVPTYVNRSEMPARTTPEQKLLKQLPLVVITENGNDIALFESEMHLWLVKNKNLKPQLDQKIIDLIDDKKFEVLAKYLIKIGHSKELALGKYQGGKNE
jgi:hypothetical protein